jgi:hypothetical protein
MERRFNGRYRTDFQVILRIVHSGQSVGPLPVSDMSESGVGMLLPVQLAPGDAVRLVIADSTLYGFIVYSKPEGSQFRTGIEVQRVLLGGTDLSRLLRQTLGETMPDLPGLKPTEIHLG